MRTIARATLVVALVGFSAACVRLPYNGGARPVNPASLDTTWQRASATPVVQQEKEMDCGLAALAMIAGAWGRHWTVEALSREVPPSQSGVKLGALRDVARKHGLIAYAMSGKHEDLARELGERRPVVVGLVLPFDRERFLNHYEVAVAFDPRDGSIVTIDPSNGRHLRRTKEVLDAEWKAGGYAMLVVVGDAGEPADNSVTIVNASRP